MKSLIERLHNNNVLFSYYGFIDDNVLSEVLRITRNKFENNRESPDMVDRLHKTIYDCVENIIQHNFFPADELLSYKSLLLVCHNEKFYSIDTINVINTFQKESIEKQLTLLHAKTKDEIIHLRLNTITKNKEMGLPDGTGLGLIDLVLGADKCDYRFKVYDSNFLFNINFEISRIKILEKAEQL